MEILRFILAVFASTLACILIIPIIILGLPFLFIVQGAEFIHAVRRRKRPGVVSWKQIMQFEPVIGWKPKPNVSAFIRHDGIFHITTDSLGWRGSTTIDESDILVFGDSYAFGYGVSDSEFFANLLKGIKIKTIGTNGYNMVQGLLLMERMRNHLNGKVVVWMIYYGNDLYENLQPNLDKYRMPFVRSVNGMSEWEIISNHVSPLEWPFYSKRDYYGKLAEICSPTLLAERVYSACEYLILEGARVCIESNARLVVLSIPDITQINEEKIALLRERAPIPEKFDPDLPDIKLKLICERNAIPFVTLKDHLDSSHYKTRDVHWNEMGNQRVAYLLKEIFLQYYKRVV
jgi:hypothetical protein